MISKQTICNIYKFRHAILRTSSCRYVPSFTFKMKQVILIILLFYYHEQVENAHTSLFIKEYLFETKVSLFFAELLLKYKDFLIVFHAEEQTVRHIDTVIRYFIYNAAIRNETQVTNFMIYNHDKKLEYDFRRPNASKIVNLLFFNKSNFWQSLSMHEKINANDVVILIGSYKNLREKVLRKGEEFVKIAGKVLLTEFTQDGSINLYDICYYCGINSMRFRLIENTNTSMLKTSPCKFLPKKFKNLHGHLFKVIFISYFPYIFCNELNETSSNETTICNEAGGIESEMMKIISSKLNFTYEVHQMNRNASFVDMIKYIRARKADIAFGGISITVDRIPIVQFTKQYNREDFTFLYLIQLTLDEVFDKFIEPFNAISVWSLYGLIFFLLSFLLFTALKIGIHHRYQTVSIYECIWVSE